MGTRALAVLTLSLLSGCATTTVMSAEQRALLDTDTAPAVAALQAARFDEATSLAKEALARHEDNARAAAVLAVSTWRLALHELATDLLTFAASVAASSLLRGNFINREFLDFAVKRADARLLDVDNALARAEKDPGFSLELCLACWEVDWNRNGELDERDRLLLEVEADARGEALPPNDPRRRPTFRFDASDVPWLRAMVSFQRAGLAIIQAWDVDLSGLATNRLDTLRLELRDAKDAQRAADLILAGLDHARRCRESVLAEADDDREWLPNPKQKSHALPLDVDDALFDTWAGVLDDVEDLLRSRTGLSAAEVAQLGDHQWETPPQGFLDLGALLTRPADHDVLVEGLNRARRREDPKAMEEALRHTFGPAWKDSMPLSRLPSRLLRMRREVDRGQDTFERKLRYLLWLN